MKRNKPLQSRTRLKPLSKKRRAVNAVRAELVNALHKARGRWCELCGLFWWTQVHEPWSRGRGGPAEDERNMCCLCRDCHRTVHDNPAWASSLGLLVSAAEGPKWLEDGGWKGIRR